eukprot:symbB.v1.2.004594.t1/scaffold261.1/size248783/22
MLFASCCIGDSSGSLPFVFAEEVVRVLICNFTERGYGCAILFALDERLGRQNVCMSVLLQLEPLRMCGSGSECDIYCSLSEEDVMSIIKNAEDETERSLKNIKVRQIITVSQHQMTSRHKINVLPLREYDFNFILADAALGFQKADEQTVAMIIQMKTLVEEHAPGTKFEPLVEVCTPNATLQLELCGIKNTINTISMMSKAMALVAIDTLAHGVLSDLLSATGNNMDITYLKDYLGSQPLPTQITFVEVAAMVNRAAHQVVIGWSDRNEDGEQVWVVNPKNKLTPRLWSADDKIVVIKDAKRHRSEIPVFICEYHNEALRCLHFSIRRHKVPFEGLTMVHLDAHPDLSASTTMAAQLIMEEPHQAYDVLRDDPSGIAQWILPAAYAGHLNCVWWLRPSWAQQIADGDYHVHVGHALAAAQAPHRDASRARGGAAVPEKEAVESLKISCRCCLKPRHPWCIWALTNLLGSLMCLGKNCGIGSSQALKELQVCMDFFACGNPFLVQVRPEIAKPFAEVLNSASFRQGSVSNLRKFLEEKEAFEAAYDKFLTEA